MADEQRMRSGTDDDKTISIGEVFEAARECKLKKDAIEALEKQEAHIVFNECMSQDAQEKQESSIEKDPETGHYIIRLNTNIDKELQAKLDPNSTQFDPVLYKEYTAEMLQNLKDTLSDMQSSLFNDTKAIQEAITPLADMVKNAVIDAFKSIMTSASYIAEKSEKLTKNIERWQQLEPYLEAELKKPEYNGISLDELITLDKTDENGDPIENSLLDKVIAAAQAAFEAEQLPRLAVTGKGASNVEYPLDKVNANIWTLLKDAPQDGQLSFVIGTEKRNSRKQADIIYSINFDELENAGLNTVKRLTAFDKRVYIAASALFNGNSDYITVSQLYATMGNDSRPNARDIEKIYTSLEKMRRLPITLDNYTGENSEYSTYKNIPKFVYNGVLLPWESVDAVVNGQRADGVIHLFREPPLISFAKGRQQITTVQRKLLASPISKTDANLQLDDYLIERIAHIKKSKGKISNKLLYSTIFEKANITTKLQRSRSKDKIKKYLEYYTSCGFIKGFKEATDGVTISY